MPAARHPHHPTRRRAGMSLVEVLISLAITAALLTAVSMALDASFTAYASAAQSTSAQTTTRMVVHRVQRLLRSGIAQGPLTPAHATEFGTLRLTGGGTLRLPVPNQLRDGSVDTLIKSTYLILDDPSGSVIVLDWGAADQTLYLSTPTPGDPDLWERRPLLRGVTDCCFTLLRRNDQQSGYETVLLRGGIDLTVQPGADSTLGTEAGNSAPIRLVASTSPRRLR